MIVKVAQRIFAELAKAAKDVPLAEFPTKDRIAVIRHITAAIDGLNLPEWRPRRNSPSKFPPKPSLADLKVSPRYAATVLDIEHRKRVSGILKVMRESRCVEFHGPVKSLAHYFMCLYRLANQSPTGTFARRHQVAAGITNDKLYQLNAHISLFKQLGLIESTESGGSSVYGFTPLGNEVAKLIVSNRRHRIRAS